MVEDKRKVKTHFNAAVFRRVFNSDGSRTLLLLLRCHAPVTVVSDRKSNVFQEVWSYYETTVGPQLSSSIKSSFVRFDQWKTQTVLLTFNTQMPPTWILWLWLLCLQFYWGTTNKHQVLPLKQQQDYLSTLTSQQMTTSSSCPSVSLRLTVYKRKVMIVILIRRLW